MTAPKIFITGATGYIGGDTLYALYNKHPEYSYTALVRSQEKGELVKKAFPNVKLRIGELKDSKILEEEAAGADVVIHTADAADNEDGAKAIASGLAQGHSKDNPGFWLHTSGTAVLCWEDMRDMDNRLGTHTDKVYDDYKDVNEIVHLPDDAIHRNVDKIVLSAGTQNADSVKTAIVCAPTIYGKGRGPGNIRSVQAYELAKTILTKQIIPVVGQGQTIWNGIHVADLADLFVLLTEAAVTRKLDTELWGAHGYYFAENGEFLWADLARLMGQKAEELGMTGSLKEQQFDMASATEFAGFVAISWGVNSRCKAERARKLLGWAPSRLSVEDTVPEILRGEKVALV